MRTTTSTSGFDALYRSHYGRVLGLCLRLLGRRSQAEDAAQEAFVRAYRAFDSYDPDQPFAAWVLGIASNHCIDLIRRRNRQGGLAEPDGEAAELVSPDTGALDALLTREREHAVRRAVDSLPDKYRAPLVLAYYREWSYEEIAAELGLTRNHVGVLLLRGRQALRRALAADDEEI